MSLSEVSEELEASACEFCIFRRKIAGEAGDLRVYNNYRLKNRFFHQFFLCIFGSYWGGYRIRFCVIPLSSIFPFMNF
jgi:hypothetical protein